MKDAKIIGYDPKMLNVYFEGDKIYGFDYRNKFSLSRRLNGVAVAKVYLQGHTDWVLKFKKLLGHSGILETAYTGEGGFAENMRFQSRMVVKGYDVDYTGEFPVFVFLLESMEQ
ncbi:hypothetical protein [Salmonella phage NINP13076]|uniref:Uncharacterized protein n=1 Tax=Salmonella phage SalP219 TaxID=3158864 RepID=A0AAU7PHW4_9CAUD|nr:hypothetical protein [Salmonella phage NINP13076]